MDKLKVGWSIRTRRFERLRKSEEKIIKSCWREKMSGNEWKDLYGREREKFL